MLTESPILAVPQPVRCKKRVSKTVYWEECPKCRQKLGHDAWGWFVGGPFWTQDTSKEVPERTYMPCGCVVRAGEQYDGDEVWSDTPENDGAWGS